ncbi:MAG: 7-cyano-7-deazaguanine synthase QueC [Candidatus Omnitrophica bacterium]|nr:7-cyano-7-deazaguanine synthase QueC [Candidatus Omnitrophota bacterium]
MKKSAVVLLSGGIDSSTALFIAKKNGYKCFSLIFDYGQRNIREIDSAKSISKKAGCSYTLLKLSLPWKGGALLDSRIKLPERSRKKGIPPTYVPARNTIMLVFALSFAESIGASRIFIGAHTEDYSGYPDCRPEYFKAFNKVKDLGTKIGKKIKIITPLIYKTKAEIIKLGINLGIPYHLTWSCYRGGKRPCGKCDSCYYRLKGFREAGISDPLKYERSKDI